jgi:hypothetical protein
MKTNEGEGLQLTGDVCISLPVTMLADIDEFAWYLYLGRTEAIRLLLKQGLSAQEQIEAPFGDCRQSPEEVVVDSRVE